MMAASLGFIFSSIFLTYALGYVFGVGAGELSRGPCFLCLSRRRGNAVR